MTDTEKIEWRNDIKQKRYDKESYKIRILM